MRPVRSFLVSGPDSVRSRVTARERTFRFGSSPRAVRSSRSRRTHGDGPRHPRRRRCRGRGDVLFLEECLGERFVVAATAAGRRRTHLWPRSSPSHLANRERTNRRRRLYCERISSTSPSQLRRASSAANWAVVGAESIEYWWMRFIARDCVGRTECVAESKSRHRVGLREAVEHDGSLAHSRERRDRRVLAAVRERRVDFVGEDRQIVFTDELRDLENSSRLMSHRSGCSDNRARARRPRPHPPHSSAS